MKVITVAWPLEPEGVTPEPAVSALFSICGKANHRQPTSAISQISKRCHCRCLLLHWGITLGSESLGGKCPKRETKFQPEPHQACLTTKQSTVNSEVIFQQKKWLFHLMCGLNFD